MTTGINWKRVRAELDGEPWEEVEPGRYERLVFLGTVFSLMPSGRYYIPFACDDVTEGEADEDEEFREQLESEAESHGLYVASKDGNPCDVFVGESRDSGDMACEQAGEIGREHREEFRAEFGTYPERGKIGDWHLIGWNALWTRLRYEFNFETEDDAVRERIDKHYYDSLFGE